MTNLTFVALLADAFIGGEQTSKAATERALQAVRHEWRWVRSLAVRYINQFGNERPKIRTVLKFLWSDARLRRCLSKYHVEIKLLVKIAQQPLPRMAPVDAADGWNLPAIETIGDLAEWLELEIAQLDWFADLAHRNRRSGVAKLEHYHYRTLPKGSGGLRQIEQPKPRMMQLQRKILADILDLMPVHAAAHGFKRGRSVKTFVAPHTGQGVVLRMDLEDFFPSISFARVAALLRIAGYPENVAARLSGICTNATKALPVPHLPQGAATSPALANLCAYRLDCRLTGLANSAGAVYTRYADDMAFSGGKDFAHKADRFAAHVAAIIHDEGFAVHHRKTRVMRPGVRQHLAGLVINQHANVSRRDFDQLKAILTNCVRHGPEGQNHSGHAAFRQHLEGRVGWVEQINPERGRKLRQIADRIQWQDNVVENRAAK